MVFSSSLCGAFVFMFVFLAFSSFSLSCFFLSQLHSSCLTQCTQFHLTQLLSSHKSHNSSHTTHLTQLISHNSTLSRAAFVWHLVELLRVLSLNFTQVLSHNSSHNSHNSSHTTPLISHYSTHLTTHTTHLTYFCSSHN